MPRPSTFRAITAALAMGAVLVVTSAVAAPRPDTGESPGVVAAAPEPPPPLVNAACPGVPLVAAKFRVEGVSRMAKLNSEITVGPGEFTACTYADGPPNRPLRIDGELGLPPSNGYFVLFRFMPSTGTVTFIQEGRATGNGVLAGGPLPGVLYFDVEITVKLFIQLTDVRQDGVPLGVGGRCRTHVPAVITMRGVVGIPSNQKPGVRSDMTATYDIPPYRGCGVTENLDPLLTGVVSGPGNQLRTTLTYQGPP